MKKIYQIFLGWWRKLFGTRSSEINEMARKRQSVCLYCRFNDCGNCQVCGCDIIAKSLISQEDCPKNKWPDWWKV